jgi:hypothetical protein
MFETKFTSRPGITPKLIEETCAGMNLHTSMKGSTKTLPPNIHWHFKKDKAKGVLEITLLLNANEVILSCKENRKADWVIGAMKELKEEFS